LREDRSVLDTKVDFELVLVLVTTTGDSHLAIVLEDGDHLGVGALLEPLASLLGHTIGDGRQLARAVGSRLTQEDDAVGAVEVVATCTLLKHPINFKNEGKNNSVRCAGCPLCG